MNTINVTAREEMSLETLEKLINTVAAHLEFYTDLEPELKVVTTESIQFKINGNIEIDDLELLKEAIEIDNPDFQVSFAQL